MEKYVCVCGFEYDPAVGAEEHGVAAGTPWEQVHDEFTCPWCGLGKDAFSPA
jgi:rubredoxin